MRRDYVGLWSPAIGAEGGLLAYGHHGRPLLVFQSEQGRCSDYEDRGMIDAAAGLIEAGRVKIYSVDSYDAASWCAADLPLEARAQQHARFEDWILHQVVPFIYDDCQGPLEIMVTGASFGAFHAANFAFRRADLFPMAICQSGVYDAERMGWGERGDTVYFEEAAPGKTVRRTAPLQIVDVQHVGIVNGVNSDQVSWLPPLAEPYPDFANTTLKGNNVTVTHGETIGDEPFYVGDGAPSAPSSSRVFASRPAVNWICWIGPTSSGCICRAPSRICSCSRT